MPDEMFAYAEDAATRGLKAIIAGAGGAAHLPGMLAAKTTVPVLGVPVASRHLQGVDSLHSIVQMPKGIPVATFAIGQAGAANAALFAVAMLANEDPALRARLDAPALGQWETAARYLMYAGFGLMLVGLAQLHAPRSGFALAAPLLAAGGAIFTGTVAALALGGPRWLGAVTPLGGLLLIVAFLIFAWSALRG